MTETHWEPHIVLNEGGPTLRHEHIIVDPNDTPPVPHDNGHSPPTSDPSPAPPLTSSRLKGTTRPPVPHDNGHQANIAVANSPEPKTHAEAMTSPDALEWLAACEEDMGMFKEMDNFNVIPQSKDRKAIGIRVVTQVEGVDYNQTFAPVAKFSHAALVLAVVFTYLNLKVKEDIYMELPPDLHSHWGPSSQRADKGLTPRVAWQVQGSHGCTLPRLRGCVGVAAAPAYTTTFSLYGNHFTLPVLDFLCLLSHMISLAFMPRVYV